MKRRIVIKHYVDPKFVQAIEDGIQHFEERFAELKSELVPVVRFLKTNKLKNCIAFIPKNEFDEFEHDISFLHKFYLEEDDCYTESKTQMFCYHNAKDKNDVVITCITIHPALLQLVEDKGTFCIESIDCKYEFLE